MQRLSVADFERMVERRARSFDLKPLLVLLARYGYGRETIRFRSIANDSASTLVESVAFSPLRREVVITVAIGLLGDSALLPSYYVREAERHGRLDEFEDFVAFFDNWLIRNYVAAVWPEDDRVVYENYPLMRRAMLGITGFSSLATMKWLVELLFPDVTHTVKRATFPTAVQGRSVYTDRGILDGSSVLGGVYKVDIDGFLVVLSVDEEVDLRDQAWATTLKLRVSQRLVPLLEPFAVPLCVELRIFPFDNALRFGKAYPDPGALGYPVLGGRRKQGEPIVLFEGMTSAGGGA